MKFIFCTRIILILSICTMGLMGCKKSGQTSNSNQNTSKSIVTTFASFDQNSKPAGLAVDGKGYLYVADQGNHTIRKINVNTGAVTTLAGSAGNTGSTDGAGIAAQFNKPNGLAIGNNDTLYVADQGNHTIRKINVNTGVVTTLAGSAGVSGSTNGIGTAAQFNKPAGLAIDGTGNLYVADQDNYAIRKIIVATGAVDTLARLNGGNGKPIATALDGIGNLYVTVNAVNNYILKINVNTGVKSIFVYHGEYVDANASNFQLFGPTGLAIDGTGNIYVADSSSSLPNIKKMVIATRKITAFVGNISSGFVNAGDNSKFNGPYALALDAANNIYVSDQNNHCIRKITIK